MSAVWTLATVLLVIGVVVVVVLVHRLDQVTSRIARRASLAAEIRRELPRLKVEADRFRADLARIDRRVAGPDRRVEA